MKKHQAPRTAARALLLSLTLTASLHPTRAHAAPPAQREHLTPEEVEQVRENQALDARMGVFVKAVERRLAAIADPTAAEKLSAKELEQWGAVKGTRAQLLQDIDRILEEAVTNIEDASIHSEKSPLIPKAVRRLGEAAARFTPRLTAINESTQADGERDMIERIVESLREITAAAGKLPAETKSEAKGKQASRN